MASTLYAHLPGLRFSGDPIAFLAGTIGPLPFPTFRMMDPAWAISLHFKTNKPFFWTAPLPDEIAPQDDSHHNFLRQNAHLLFLAITAKTARIFPDPRLSTSYVVAKPSFRVSSCIGPAHRNAILHGNTLPPFERGQIVDAAALAARWSSYGIAPDSPIFHPLRTIGNVAFAEPNAIIGLLPVMIALEGLLVGKEVQGVVKHMLKTINLFCNPELGPSNAEALYKAYDYRSRLVHGRHIGGVQDAVMLFQRIRALAGAVVVAMIEDARRSKIPADGLIAYLDKRIANGS
jgi:hypothetical protein